MGVVPVRAGLGRLEAIREALTGRNGILRHTGDAVVTARHRDAVPVDRDAFGDVSIAKRDFHDVALGRLDRRSAQFAVRPGLDLRARCQLDRGARGLKGQCDIRRRASNHRGAP